MSGLPIVSARTVLSADDYGIELTVWSKGFEPLGQIYDFEQLDATARHLARGTAEFVLEDDAEADEWLRQPGARICLKVDGEVFLSGIVEERAGTLGAGGTIRYTITDDWAWLDNLAYVVPDGPLRPATLDDLGQAVAVGTRRTGTVEGQDGYYPWPRGISAEAAAYRLLAENLVQRLGLAARVGATAGLGGAVELPGVRFGSLEEYVVRILGAAGLGLNVWHDPAAGPWVGFTVTQPDEFAQELDPDSGVIVDGEWILRAPKTTRALILGSGEDAARDFQEYRDQTGLERDWGVIRETTKDVTGSAPKWPEGLEDALQVPKYFGLRGDEDPAEVEKYRSAKSASGSDVLAEGLPTAGIDATLAEDGDFYLGPGGFRVGDRVLIRAGSEPISDRITEARLVVDGDGRRITPIVGAYTDDSQRSTRDAIDRIAFDNARRSRR